MRAIPSIFIERVAAARAALPGLALCAAVSAAAEALALAQGALFGRAWIDALVIAILLGALLRAWRPLPPRFDCGIAFGAKTLLEIAVVLIGASISAATILAGGLALALAVVAAVGLSLAAGVLIGRALGLNPRMALLIAVGNAICGNSAIAAVAPIIGASARDVAASVAFTAVLGVTVVLALPVLATAWSMSAEAFGIFAGLTVYAVPQVLAATAPISSLSAQIGTVVKLMRVLMLGPIVLGLSLLRERAPAAGRPRLGQLVPWFIIGFLVMMGLRTAGMIPRPLLPAIAATSGFCTLMAMAGLGLGVDIRDVARAGPRVTAAVTASILVLGAIALAAIRIAGLG